MTTADRTGSAERVAAWATGVGVGLAVFMISWLIGSRIAALWWEAPVAPVVAMLVALATGTGAAVRSAHQLASSLGS
jgi:hypothetical protein